MIETADLAVARALAEQSFDPRYFNLTPAEMAQIDFAAYFRSMRVHLRDLRSFCLPDGIVMWSRTLSLLFALLSELAPGLRPLDIVGPYVMQFLLPSAQMSSTSSTSNR